MKNQCPRWYSYVNVPFLYSGNASLWHLSEALQWLNEGNSAKRYNIPEWKIDVATTAKEINFAVEVSRTCQANSKIKHPFSKNIVVL